MHKAERPSNYFFFSNTFTHNQAEHKKERSNLCPNFVRNTPDLNTLESTFKVEQVHFTPVLVPVNYCRCYIGKPAYPSI